MIAQSRESSIPRELSLSSAAINGLGSSRDSALTTVLERSVARGHKMRVLSIIWRAWIAHLHVWSKVCRSCILDFLFGVCFCSSACFGGRKLSQVCGAVETKRAAAVGAAVQRPRPQMYAFLVRQLPCLSLLATCPDMQYIRVSAQVPSDARKEPSATFERVCSCQETSLPTRYLGRDQDAEPHCCKLI